MATRSTQQMATDVMLDLGLIEASQSPSATDADYIKRRYADLMEELRDDLICYWPDNAIPVVVYERIIKLVGLSVGGAFGLPMPSGRAFEVEMQAAKNRVRKHTALRSSGLSQAVDDF